ncbi:MAG: hypothetical protein ACNA7W_04485, partial [Pseudomonadales bacterium]
IENEMRRVQAGMAMGIYADAAAVNGQLAEARILGNLNGEAAKAPSGDDAFAAAAGAANTGIIQIVVTGAPSTANFQAVVTRPVYFELPQQISTLSWTNI